MTTSYRLLLGRAASDEVRARPWWPCYRPTTTTIADTAKAVYICCSVEEKFEAFSWSDEYCSPGSLAAS